MWPHFSRGGNQTPPFWPRGGSSHPLWPTWSWLKHPQGQNLTTPKCLGCSLATPVWPWVGFDHPKSIGVGVAEMATKEKKKKYIQGWPPPYFCSKIKFRFFFKKRKKRIVVFFIIFLTLCGIESKNIICDTWSCGNRNRCQHSKVGDMEVF